MLFSINTQIQKVEKKCTSIHKDHTWKSFSISLKTNELLFSLTKPDDPDELSLSLSMYVEKSFFLKIYISLSFPSFRCRLCLYAMPWCGCTFLESNPQPPLSPMCGCLFPFKINIAMMPLTQYSTFLSKYDNHIIFHKSTNPSSTIHPSSRIFLLKRTKVKAF